VKGLRIGGVLVLLILLVGCATGPDLVPDYKQAEDSVVILIHDYGMTSGVVITEDGYILSCAHAGKPKQVYVKTYFDDMDMALIIRCDQVETIYIDNDLDIGIYRIIDDRKFVWSRIAETNPEQGGEVFSLGTPLGSPYYISWGKIIKTLYNFDIGLGYFLSSCSGNAGNSGGPLFNMDGEIIGINVSLYAAIPTMAGYVSLIDGMLAVRVTNLTPAIWGIIDVHRAFREVLEEFAVAEKHIEELVRDRPD